MLFRNEANVLKDVCTFCNILKRIFVCQEESGETVCSDSNGVAKWLCPLCQQEQLDRGSLSQHLTDRHSVLPTCVDKLLDIVSIIYMLCGRFATGGVI